MAPDLFNVVLFFPDGSSHYEQRGLGPKEAVELAKQCTERPAARIGMIDRVIITDCGDCTNFEWCYGKGVTFK
jgi:hypothetical protein